MLAGKIIRFDATRGYGFIAPEPGGEDVFVHVNDLGFDEALMSVGTRVEFEMVASDRGPKAYDVRVMENGAEKPEVVPAVAVPSTDDECEVLSEREFGAELVEVLLAAVPSLTGTQIVAVRTAALRLARSHGWLD
jgi:cold shock CspA family protein